MVSGISPLVTRGGSRTGVAVQASPAECAYSMARRVCVYIDSCRWYPSCCRTRLGTCLCFCCRLYPSSRRSRRCKCWCTCHRSSQSYCHIDQYGCLRCCCRQCRSYSQIDPCEGCYFGRRTEELISPMPATQGGGES